MDVRYFQWDYDKGIVIEYKRLGECNGCGDCCKAEIRLSANVYDNTVNQQRDGGGYTDMKGIWNEVREDNRSYFFHFSPINTQVIDEGHRCPMLTQANKCAVYNNRQRICTTWPTSPDQVEALPNCSYRFELVKQYTIEEYRKEFGDRDLRRNRVESTSYARLAQLQYSTLNK